MVCAHMKIMMKRATIECDKNDSSYFCVKTEKGIIPAVSVGAIVS